MLISDRINAPWIGSGNSSPAPKALGKMICAKNPA